VKCCGFLTDFGAILHYDRSNCQMQLLGFLVLLGVLFQKKLKQLSPLPGERYLNW